MSGRCSTVVMVSFLDSKLRHSTLYDPFYCKLRCGTRVTTSGQYLWTGFGQCYPCLPTGLEETTSLTTVKPARLDHYCVTEVQTEERREVGRHCYNINTKRASANLL